jgi:para-nitrobenzyl esterase
MSVSRVIAASGWGGRSTRRRRPFHRSLEVDVSRVESSALWSIVLTFLVAASPAGAQLQVQVESGRLEGSTAGDVESFKGIPFAAAPVGELRWRAPQPAPRWQGVRAATGFGSDCMQEPFPSDAAPLGVPPAEDCLYLNVWRPAERSEQKLPVMVWIYGGGFVNGGSSPAVYDGNEFARQGVVLVSFNYRVGRFGFFAHPELTREAGAEPVANYGYMDQIAALQWVRRNIAAFGGDPDNVTIFGESAGGGSVLTLLTAPAVPRGTFHKAVVQSGGGRSMLMGMRRLGEDIEGRPSAEKVGVAFARSVGIDGTGAAALAALRALPAETLVQGLNMATMGQQAETYQGGPILDGRIVVETPEEALRAGRHAGVPVMIGATSLDIGFSFARDRDALFATFGPHAEAARAAYDPSGELDFRMLGQVVGADRMMVEPARFVARTVAAQGLPAYQFRFSYVAESLRDRVPGALHATEIPYVFNTIRANLGDSVTPADAQTARAANAYWANFARTGDPNGAGLPRWERYDAATDRILDFTNKGPVLVADPWRTRLDLVESTLPGR